MVPTLAFFLSRRGDWRVFASLTHAHFRLQLVEGAEGDFFLLNTVEVAVDHGQGYTALPLGSSRATLVCLINTRLCCQNLSFNIACGCTARSETNLAAAFLDDIVLASPSLQLVNRS